MRPIPIEVLGSSMYVDDGDILNLTNNHIYESLGTQYAQQHIKSGMKVLDIGAHIGYYTCLFSKLVGPDGFVYAFEPNLVNYKTNVANLQLNKITNVEIVNAAASDKKSMGKMYICNTNSGDHRTFHSGAEPNRPSYDIACLRIDDFTNERDITDKINFVKIDTQGYETAVLSGMTEVLQKSKDIIVVTEFWPYGAKQAGFTSKQFLDVCLLLGFKYSVLTKNQLIEDYPIQKLLSQSQDNPNWGVDLIWKK